MLPKSTEKYRSQTSINQSVHFGDALYECV